MTAKGEYTPGPWKVYHAALRPQFSSYKIIEIQSDHGNAIVMWAGFDNCERTKKTHLANARLMAAAPDMLRVMKSTKSIFANFCESEENIKLYDEFCDAIAKAEGRRR